MLSITYHRLNSFISSAIGDRGGLEVTESRDMISPLSSKHSNEIGVPAEKDSSSDGSGKLITSCHGVVLKSAFSWLMHLVSQHAQIHRRLTSSNRSEPSESLSWVWGICRFRRRAVLVAVSWINQLVRWKVCVVNIGHRRAWILVLCVWPLENQYIAKFWQAWIVSRRGLSACNKTRWLAAVAHSKPWLIRSEVDTIDIPRSTPSSSSCWLASSWELPRKL